MSGGDPQPARMTPRQALGWGMAFLVIVVLVVLFFLFGRQVRPVLGALPIEAWPTSLS
jgi:antibiotic biosynthesis monooxygenase (ABM) superfamily enzyme